MRAESRMSQRGIAMVTAIVLALAVSAIAAVVLSLTFRRFELSAFRTDHAVAAGTAEAGLQYVFARLDQDQAFRNAVQAKRLAVAGGETPVAADNAAAEFNIRCHDDPALTEDQIEPALHMGGPIDSAKPGKHVTLRIRFFTDADNPPFPARPYRVRSFSNFGTGE